MNDRCKISVVVPYYNKWPRARYLLESLNRQDMGREFFEVIMVDDGSELPLENLVSDFPVNFNLTVLREENRGRSAARNFGFRQAQGESILFVDDDIILPPGFVRCHYEEHSRARVQGNDSVFVHGKIYDLIELTPYDDPETGTYFPFLNKNINPPIQSAALLSFAKVFEDWESFSKKKRLSRLEKLIRQVLLKKELSFLHWIGCVGGNLSIKSSVFVQTGGFDEDFRVWGGEDFELGYRLVKQGVSAVYNDQCFVYHMTHAHNGYFEERNSCGRYFFEKHQDQNIKLFYNFLEMNMTAEEFIDQVMGVKRLG